MGSKIEEKMKRLYDSKHRREQGLGQLHVTWNNMHIHTYILIHIHTHTYDCEWEKPLKGEETFSKARFIQLAL